MPKLPQVSGSDVIELLQSIGYKVVRQRGSHIRLRKVTSLGEPLEVLPPGGKYWLGFEG